MQSNNKFRAIDFFCGGGGMTCGLRQAGIDAIRMRKENTALALYMKEIMNSISTDWG